MPKHRVAHFFLHYLGLLASGEKRFGRRSMHLGNTRHLLNYSVLGGRIVCR